MSRAGTWTLLVLALIGCKAKTSSSTPTLQAVEVAVAKATIAEGQPDAITATAVYSDGSRLDVSVHATWGSSAPFVATVGCGNASCTVSTSNLGTVILTGTYEGKFGTATIEVVPAEPIDIAVTVAQATIPKGETTEVRALSNFTDTSTFDVSARATWTSSDESVATVSCGEDGCVATGLAEGNATLTASLSGFSGSVDLHVTQAIVKTVTLSEAMLTLDVGATQAVTATGHFSDESSSDVTSLATWVSSDTDVATVTGGTIEAIGAGQATITASMGVAQATLTVLVEATQTGLVITTASPTVPLGATFQLRVDAILVGDAHVDVSNSATWSSSDTSVAAVSAHGLLSTGGTGRMTGTATITASYGGFSDTTVVTVGPPAPASIAIAAVPVLHAGDAPTALVATVVDTNGGTHAPNGTVTWSSANTSLATVDASGQLRPKAAGSVTVTAGAEDVTGSRTVQIQGALSQIVLSPQSATITSGMATIFTASAYYQGASGTSALDEDVTWTNDPGLFVNVTQESRARVLVGCNTTGSFTLTATVALASGSLSSLPATVRCQ